MKASVRRLLALAALAFPAGCCLQATTETADGGLVDAGQDGTDPGASDAGFGRLPDCFVVNPTSIDFGDVDVNTTATLTLAGTNNCGVDLRITIGTLRGNDPLLFATVPSSDAVIPVADKGTVILTVQYTPLVASQENGAYFTIEVCGQPAPCVLTVQLSGTAESSCGLDIEPTTLDFGFVPTATSVVKFVTVDNSCSQALVHLTADPAVLNTDATGSNSSAGPFQPGAGFPIKDSVIRPGESVQIPIVFTPTGLAKFIGTLYLSTDDAADSNITISLLGVGQ
jgi:hypothetical protein